VETLVIAHHVHGESVEILADNYDLPVEMVQESLDYYEAHRAEIDNLIRIEDDIAQFYETHRRFPSDEEFQKIVRRADSPADDPEEDDFSFVPPELQKAIDGSRAQHRRGQTISHEEFWRLLDQINEAADSVSLSSEDDRWLDFARSQMKRALENDEIEQFYREWVNRAASPEEFERRLNKAPDVGPEIEDDRLDKDDLTAR